MSRARWAVPVVAAVFIAACGGGSPDRQDVLTELSDTTIIPAYERLAADTSALQTATSSLCSTLSAENLADTRAALAVTRAGWSYSQAMWVGPVMSRRSWAVIDWPIAPEEIEELIADTSIELDTDRLANRIGADQRGLGALEYILGDPSTDPAVLSDLEDARRCQYITGLTTVIADEAALIPDDWTVSFDDGPAYREVFSEPEGDGLDSIVNDSLFLLEAMADAELGRAVGAMDREADLDAIIEGPAGLAKEDLAEHLAGLRAVMVGAGEAAGLNPLLGDDLTDRLTVAFDAADVAVEAIDAPLRSAAADTPESILTARDAIKALQVIIATEVVSRLGVTIGFSDADGDTGS